MSGEHLGGTEGMSEAREAFQSTMDAETPSRSRTAKEKPEEQRMDIEELFPSRRMDRREKEGGADTEPDIVRQRRAEAKQRNPEAQTEFEDEPPPRTPTEGTDEDEGDDDDQPLPDDEDVPEDEAEDEEPEEGRERAQLDLDALVEVTVDGKPVEVSLKEALRGYIRQETFHQRVNEVAEASKVVHTQRNELVQYQQAFVERAQALEAYINEFMPSEPDWEQLYQQDPQNAHLYKLRWDKFAGQVRGLVEKRAATQQELAATYQTNLTNFAAANRVKLASSHPEWRNEKVWKRDHDSMRRTARSEGYSDDEINQLYDARGVNILLKAAKYDRLMASKPKPVQGSGHPSKRSASTPSRNLTRSFERAEKRLSRTGSVNDAAAVFESILDRER
jgi:hypothetical protein